MSVIEYSGFPVLLLEGELTHDGESALTQAMQSVLALPATRTIFDFRKVQYINSGGISILLNLISRARSSERSIIFCGLSRHLSRVIEIVGMDEFVVIRGTLDEAVSS